MGWFAICAHSEYNLESVESRDAGEITCLKVHYVR